jgi:putative redox protein
MKASVTWNQAMNFTVDNRGHVSAMDAGVEFGGADSAATPKELLLNAMMGCSGMDVVSMLQKMRCPLESFEMSAEAQKNEHYPIYLKNIHITYTGKGSTTPEQFIKAVSSSMNKYCGVSYMISKSSSVTYTLHLNGQEIYKDQTHFTDPEN